jgi:hypothetical protein
MYKKTHVEEHAFLTGYEERYWNSRQAASHYFGNSKLLRPTYLRQTQKLDLSELCLGGRIYGNYILKCLGCERECSSSTFQRMPGNVLLEYRPQENGRFRYTTRGLSGTHFLGDDKISGVSKYRFSFMTTAGSWITLLVLFGTICTWNDLV